MKPHVTKLRNLFQSKVQQGLITADSCCINCGATSRLQLHHVIPIASCPPERNFDPNVQENLITLCDACHYAYHRVYESDYPEDKILQWIEEVPTEVVFREGEAHRQAKREKSRREAAKHRK